jgi:hypothetical protein
MSVDAVSASKALVGPTEALASDADDRAPAARGSGAPSRGMLVVLCLIEAAWIGVLIAAAVFGTLATSDYIHGLF